MGDQQPSANARIFLMLLALSRCLPRNIHHRARQIGSGKPIRQDIH
jgi:hypothetical protein